jgi:pyruvate,water dikinase
LPLEEIGREHADVVGGKTANLGEVRNKVGLPVPAGFGITSFAYRSFVVGAGLQPRLTEVWRRIDWDDWASVERASATMTELVQQAALPQDVAEEIALAAHDLYNKARGRGGPLERGRRGWPVDLRRAVRDLPQHAAGTGAAALQGRRR